MMSGGASFNPPPEITLVSRDADPEGSVRILKYSLSESIAVVEEQDAYIIQYQLASSEEERAAASCKFLHARFQKDAFGKFNLISFEQSSDEQPSDEQAATGQTVRAFCRAQTTIEFHQRIQLCLQFAQMLKAFHDSGHIHLDIKTENVHLQKSKVVGAKKDDEEAEESDSYDLHLVKVGKAVPVESIDDDEDEDALQSISDPLLGETTALETTYADKPQAGLKSDVYSSADIIFSLLGVSEPRFHESKRKKLGGSYSYDGMTEIIPEELKNEIAWFLFLMSHKVVSMRPSSSKMIDFFTLISEYLCLQAEEEKAEKKIEIIKFLIDIVVDRTAISVGFEAGKEASQKEQLKLIHYLYFYFKNYYKIDLFFPIESDSVRSQLRQKILEKLDAWCTTEDTTKFSELVKGSEFINEYFFKYYLKEKKITKGVSETFKYKDPITKIEATYIFSEQIFVNEYSKIIKYELIPNLETESLHKFPKTIVVKIMENTHLEYNLLNDSKSMIVYEHSDSQIAMEYIPGENIRKFSSREQLKSFQERTDLCLQFSVALANLHCRGIIHKDIKCENVLIEDLQSDDTCITESYEARQATERQFRLRLIDLGGGEWREEKLQGDDDSEQEVSNLIASPFTAPKEVFQRLVAPKSDTYSSMDPILTLLGAKDSTRQGKKRWRDEYTFLGIEEHIPEDVFPAVKSFLELMQKEKHYLRPSSMQMVAFFQLLHRYAIEEGESEQAKYVQEIKDFVIEIYMERIAYDTRKLKAKLKTPKEQYENLKDTFQKITKTLGSECLLPEYDEALSNSIKVLLCLINSNDGQYTPSGAQIVEFCKLLSQYHQLNEDAQRDRETVLDKIESFAVCILLDNITNTVIADPHPDLNTIEAKYNKIKEIYYELYPNQYPPSLPDYNKHAELQPCIDAFFGLLSASNVSINLSAEQKFKFFGLLNEYDQEKTSQTLNKIEEFVISCFIENHIDDVLTKESPTTNLSTKTSGEGSLNDEAQQFEAIERVNNFLKKFFQVDLFIKPSEDEKKSAKIREFALKKIR